MVDGEELEDMINEAYARDGVSQSILITRSNKRATEFNLAIRSRIFYSEEELTSEELLLVAKTTTTGARR